MEATTATALACFEGFSCCDASLRHEGCFFSGVGLPKLASEHADPEEETKGATLASQQEVLLVLVKITHVDGVRFGQRTSRGEAVKHCLLPFGLRLQTVNKRS